MTIDYVFQNIQLAETVFRELIVTSNYRRINNSITWDNYTPGIYKNLYAKEYEIVIKNRQYSFLLTRDKGCIQIFYDFKDGNLQKVKLAYYPYPAILNDEQIDVENFIDDSDDRIIQEYYYDLWSILTHQFELSLPDEKLQDLISTSLLVGNDEKADVLLLKKFDSKYQFTNSSHLRVDFDANVNTHHKCEIQVGAINYIRLPLNKIITPFTFFDFIAKNIYPNEYQNIRSKAAFPTNLSISKNNSFPIIPFTEENIFLSHL